MFETSRIAIAARFQHAITLPHPGARIYDQSISISGTIELNEGSSEPRAIKAWMAGRCIGQTRIFGQSSPQRQLRYKILGKLPEPITESHRAEIVITLSSESEKEAQEIARLPVNLVPARLSTRDYGNVLHPDQAKVLSRENIYGSGPPVEKPSTEVLDLLLSFLLPKSSIIDVGCGAGAYVPGLIEAGHQWLGLEVNDNCIDLLTQRKLPHRKLSGPMAGFPCADREFDHAICIEVLEHIQDSGFFLGEITRVISGRAIFSVPNLEVLPFFKDWEVVPWHLLEADHKNFFTRASLAQLLAQHLSRVEVFRLASFRCGPGTRSGFISIFAPSPTNPACHRSHSAAPRGARSRTRPHSE